MTGDIDGLLAIELPRVIAGADDAIRVIGLGLAGRRDEARLRLDDMRQSSRIPLFAAWLDYLSSWLDRRGMEMVTTRSRFDHLKIRDDPEAIFQEGWMLCDAGDYENGLAHIQRAIDRGYYPATTLATRSQFDPVRDTPAFRALLASAEAGRQRALEAFRQAGGVRLLA